MIDCVVFPGNTSNEGKVKKNLCAQVIQRQKPCLLTEKLILFVSFILQYRNNLFRVITHLNNFNLWKWIHQSVQNFQKAFNPSKKCHQNRNWRACLWNMQLSPGSIISRGNTPPTPSKNSKDVNLLFLLKPEDIEKYLIAAKTNLTTMRSHINAHKLTEKATESPKNTCDRNLSNIEIIAWGKGLKFVLH